MTVRRATLALFVLALLVRVGGIARPPFDFAVARQLRSAIIARAFYDASQPQMPAWQSRVAQLNREAEGLLEPPILEVLAAQAYRVLGREALAVPRLLSIVFWLLGGYWLFRTVRLWDSAGSAFFATAFYLFNPFGIAASRSFQPDPLMVMLLLLTLHRMALCAATPSASGAVLAGLAAALAILAKPTCAFLIAGAWIGLRGPGWRGFFDRRTAILAALGLSPALAYYLHGLFVTASLTGQARWSFAPHLLFTIAYWRGWLYLMGLVVGLLPAAAGLLATPPGPMRRLLIGLWGGYVCFGLVFTYHISTHEYYHLPLVPVVALAMGPLASRVVARVPELPRRRVAAAIGLLVVAVAVAAAGPAGRGRKLLRAAIGLDTSFADTLDPELRARAERAVQRAEEIGRLVGHSTHTLFLDDQYGLGLEYYGELHGSGWPSSTDLAASRDLGIAAPGADERWDRLRAELRPEYLIVTDLVDYWRQPELRARVEAAAAVVQRGPDYVIYDLR